MKKYTKAIYTGVAAILIGLVAFTATAFAATAAAPDDGSLLDLIKPVVSAVTSGEYVYASALALVVVVAALRRPSIVKRIPFVGTEFGAALLVLVGSFASALATTLGGGGSLSWSVLQTAGGVAVAAAGGFAILKELLIKPLLLPLVDKAPAWARPVLKTIVWVFSSPSRVAEAEKAGREAVAANPSNGVADVVGEPEEIA